MHYYTPDGQRFAPVKADGKPYLSIPKDVVRKHGAVVGATDILSNVGSKAGLMAWMSGLAIESAAEVAIEIADSNPVKDRVVELSKDRFALSKNLFADRGSEMHDALEKGLRDPKFKAKSEMAQTAITSVRNWMEGMFSNPGTFSFEKTFYYSGGGLRYGGTVDAISDHDLVIIDWKFPDKDRPPRISELAQGAAYSHAISHNANHQGFIGDGQRYMFLNVFISPHTGEIMKVINWTARQMALGMAYFQTAFNVMELEEEISAEIKGIQG